MVTGLTGLGKGINIFVSISATNGVEVLTYDSASMLIKDYGYAPLEYDDLKRTVDYANLRMAMENIFAQKGISPAKATIHFTLPLVWFAQKNEVPLILDDIAIDNIVLTELDSSPYFSNASSSPAQVWFDNTVVVSDESRNIFYTAIQQDAIEQLAEIVTSMGGMLGRVGCSMIAELNGLKASGIASNLILEENSDWNLIIITNSGYQFISMHGAKFAEYYEDALPLKSFDGDEVYAELGNALQIALMSTSATELVVLSDTDLVSADIVAERLQFTGNVIPIECNQFKKTPIQGVDLQNLTSDEQLQISLQAIGSVIVDPMIQDVDYAAKKSATIKQDYSFDLGGIKVTPMLATAIAGGVLVLLLIAGFGANTYLSGQADKYDKDLQAKTQEYEQIQEEIKTYSSESTGSFDPVSEIEKVLKVNKLKVMSYTALGESVPKNLYLTYFMTGKEGDIDIKGCASSVEDIYVFFRNLKDSLAVSTPNPLRISSLDLKSSSVDEIVKLTSSPLDDSQYVFEITNMSDEALSTFSSYLTGKQGDSDNNSGNANTNNSQNNQSSNNASNNNNSNSNSNAANDAREEEQARKDKEGK